MPTEKYILTIYGDPVPQGRPRFFRRGAHVGTYDPIRSRTWKQDVRLQAIAQLGGAHHALHEGPVCVDLYFYLQRPKSLPARIKHHIKRPDRDNLEKGVLDALKGLLWQDDSQIVDGRTRKMYGSPPRVVIAIQMIPMDAPQGMAFPLAETHVASIAATSPPSSQNADGAPNE